VSRALRGVAVAVALAALIDPALDRHHREPIRVGVRVATTGAAPEAEAALARVAEQLGTGAVIVREIAGTESPWCADVDVCAVLSDDTSPIGGWPARAVQAARLRPAGPMRVVAARALPGHAGEFAEAVIAVSGGREGESADIVIEDRGVEVGRVSHTRTGQSVDRDVTVPWWPRGVGARTVVVRLKDAGGSAVPPAAMLADTTEAPADVLVWEARPSWTGTFVRRTLQDDARLSVRAASQLAPGRVVGRGVDRRPDDAALRRALAVVVTGANALDSASVGRLERFARGGGVIVVALDEDPAGPVRDLLPAALAVRRRALDPVLVGGVIRAAELIGFADSPGAVPIARWPDDPGGAAVVVERPIGRGRVVVSGTLDAWRWRDGGHAFDRFWQNVVVRATRAAVPALGLSWTSGHGGSTVRVVSRDGVIAGTWPELRLAAVCDGVRTPLAPQETASTGTWIAAVPHATDGCVIEAATASAAVSIAWPGMATVPAAAPEADRLDRIASASGGEVLPLDALVDRVAMLASTSARPLVPAPWHPMRAWWWFVPFTAALGVEWWLRRRRGMA
jgi:hypothetical protein